MMSEPQTTEFDGGTPPLPLGSEGSRPGAGSLPPAPHNGEHPAAVVDADQWPHPAAQSEPAGAKDQSGAEPVPNGFGPLPTHPGEHRDPAEETTSVIGRDWLTEQIDRHQVNPGAHGGPQAPTVAIPNPVRGGAAPPGPAVGDAGPAGASWQQPVPAGAWPGQPHPGSARDAVAPAAAVTEWTGAQGSAASWNYVDNIRSAELVPTRRIPPRRGWRKVLYYSTFKLFNPGQSRDERYQAELEVKVRSLLRGTYKIAVLGKGGVGKSTTTAGVGSVFADLRQDDRVVAVDADTAFGKLSARIDPKVAGSYWEVAGDRNLHTFADIRARVGTNKAGLFVLGGAPETARRRVLDPDIYRRAIAQLDRHFTLSIIDCGSTIDCAVTREVLDDVDALIVVSSPWFDGATAAGQTMEWLANSGYTALLHRTVVVVNDSDGHADKKDLKLLVERFGRHGQKVIHLPYDQHLRPGGVIDVHEVNPLTRRRLLELAAECAEHFASTTDRPRRRSMPAQPPAAGVVDARGGSR